MITDHPQLQFPYEWYRQLQHYTEIVIEDGQLSYKIQKNDDEPIAESKGVFFSADFDVEVEESGTYTVTVTGEKAKGSVKFLVESTE